MSCSVGARGGGDGCSAARASNYCSHTVCLLAPLLVMTAPTGRCDYVGALEANGVSYANMHTRPRGFDVPSRGRAVYQTPRSDKGCVSPGMGLRRKGIAYMAWPGREACHTPRLRVACSRWFFKAHGSACSIPGREVSCCVAANDSKRSDERKPCDSRITAASINNILAFSSRDYRS